jgi:uncharacterized protein YgiM (DUF1202 family)
MEDKEQNQEFKKEFERVAKENYKLRNENKSMSNVIEQLNQEKRILLQKLTKEIKFRIEFESELILLHKEAENMPFY